MIREARTLDSIFVSKLVASSAIFFQDEVSGNLPRWFFKSLSPVEIELRIESRHYTTLVFEEKGIILGYICLEEKYHLSQLFVSPEFHRRGIATALWREAKSRCVSSYYSVNSSRYAVPLYQSFGFKNSGEPVRQDGVEFQPMEYSAMVEKD